MKTLLIALLLLLSTLGLAIAPAQLASLAAVAPVACGEDCKTILVPDPNGPDRRCAMCGGVVRWCY